MRVSPARPANKAWAKRSYRGLLSAGIFGLRNLNIPAFTDLENQDALGAIENSEIHEIHQIQEALKRISEGTYGICAHCGEDIDPKRLEALPTATRCILCAA